MTIFNACLISITCIILTAWSDFVTFVYGPILDGKIDTSKNDRHDNLGRKIMRLTCFTYLLRHLFFLNQELAPYQKWPHANDIDVNSFSYWFLIQDSTQFNMFKLFILSILILRFNSLTSKIPLYFLLKICDSARNRTATSNG